MVINMTVNGRMDLCMEVVSIINLIGIYYYKDGSLFEGSFANGKRSGKGTYTRNNDDKYEGEWDNGVLNTGIFLNKHVGVCIYKSGSKYEGGFLNGKKMAKEYFILPTEISLIANGRMEELMGTVY